MARLNIEDQFWLDVMPLMMKLGNQDEAIGQAVRFFRFAQEKHKQGKLISEEEYAAHGFSESLMGLFAKRTPSGIQAIGAEKHFTWLDQKVEAGRAGGRISAQRPRDKKGRLTCSDGKIHQAKPSEIQPSISSSSSSSSSPSSSSSSNKIFAADEDPSPPKPEKSPVAEIREAFLESYKAQFGKDYPGWGAKENGQAKNWLRSIPKIKALEYIGAYVRWTDPYVVRAGHDFGLLVSKTPALEAHLSRPEAIYMALEENKLAQREAQHVATVRQFEKSLNSNVVSIGSQLQPKISDSA